MKKFGAFVRLLIISSMTKLADLLVSPKTTLPWLITATGAPSWLIPMLVPVKESGSLLPQWILRTTLVHQFENRMTFWRIGMAVQGIGIVSLVLSVFWSDPMWLSVIWILLLFAIAFGRSICSLTMKDIQGSNVEKGRRGRLVGAASSISGALTIVTSLALLWFGDKDNVLAVKLLIVSGGALFLFAMLPSLAMQTRIDDAKESSPRLREIFAVVSENQALRSLIISRSLLLHSALVLPFIVALSASTERFDLPIFMILSAIASLLSSYVWGALSDKSAVLTLKISSFICVIAAMGAGFLESNAVPLYAYICFFTLSIGHAGIRTGRKTYILDITEKGERTTYVAIANTLVGVVLLLLGGVYALLENALGSMVLLVMATVLVLGFLHTFMLAPEK
ncbi:MFS transporter [Aestuariibacter sp. AA17]|uniref:MFS transporter n=1 Tax=Fluctibacter corallii TaxID=2984329 RepID=A0ABT3A929_9ALTE|nr:MFS transporter [Aestuariibacter sp. AA17]MCV2885154.1 MFS transporter [Aestuariibacter sp. AA17]